MCTILSFHCILTVSFVASSLPLSKPLKWTTQRLPAPNQHGSSTCILLLSGVAVVTDWGFPPALDDQSPSSPVPIVVVMPGVGSHSESRYIKRFSHLCMENQWQVCIFHPLGCHATESLQLDEPRLFTFGGTDDLAALMKHLRTTRPK